MNTKELYSRIVKEFLALPGMDNMLSDKVVTRAKTLTPEEAIGVTERKDYPILAGKDVMIEAEYKGSFGQAFTEAPVSFSGTLEEILSLPFERDAHGRSLLIATINAVMSHMGLCQNVIHCKNQGPKLCGVEVASYVKDRYSNPKLLLIGYQPSMLENLAAQLPDMRVLDLNPDNIGQVRFGITVGHGIDDRDEWIEWADLILCTGSSACNATLGEYLETGKPTLFYGTTLAGIAALLNLERLCFADSLP